MAKRFDGRGGPRLLSLDDDWSIQPDDDGVKITNIRTGHDSVLGYDHIHHFTSDPSRGTNCGFLTLNVQVHIGGDHLWIEPTARPGEPLPDHVASSSEPRRVDAGTTNEMLLDLAGPHSHLRVMEPLNSNLVSRHYYRFVLLPDDDRAGRRLTGDVEQQFKRCAERSVNTALRDQLVIRKPEATYFRCGTSFGGEQRFALTTKGAIGFITHACIRTDKGPLFVPVDFCRDLVNFLILASSFYQTVQYSGDNLLQVAIAIPDTARLYSAASAPGAFFDPPFETIQTDQCLLQSRVTLNPPGFERLQRYLEEVMHDLARMAGSNLHESFRARTQNFVNDALLLRTERRSSRRSFDRLSITTARRKRARHAPVRWRI